MQIPGLESATASPRAEGFRQPAEWEPHAAVWLAWPSHAELWGSALAEVRREWVALVEAIADVAPDGPRGERVEVLVPDARQECEAKAALGRVEARFHPVPFGDIWLRDTAPIFVRRGAEVAPVCFDFNGWGGRYRLEGDAEVAERIASRRGGRRFDAPWVLEGGSVEPDGEGTLLTTRQCLAAPNRNPGLDRGEIEARLRESLGAERVLWLGEGLANDHTDGHVDTLARFVEPGRVVCMEPRDDDPNRAVLEAVARDLASMRDHQGRPLQVERVPSPGRVLDPDDGTLLPASYVNFAIANTTVVVPTYGGPHDAEAVERLAALFPTRRVVGRSARAILTGGGAFHCITQHEPDGDLA